ncbi:RodZ domain-containing protein [Shewanella salipaludis]|uniref:DUF4115 domain-containing protein n=1 Tax=Shewanella salipaludis TaxID=2723052 RepID=A0A972JJT6_9GAMM|nr:RodZ domain-containing protein [Shewanella salipaludis]NMH65495.1 DUF4115 domain-containing protein [Shewanella salipaludis]
MTDKHTDVHKDDAQDKDSAQQITLGQLLKTARENKGLSIDDVAFKLNLRPCMVRDIEADNFANISSPTYVRGYAKNFARLVEADKQELEACLQRQAPQVTEPVMQSFSRKTTHEARDSRLMLVTYLVIFALLALLVLWWVQKSSLTTDIDFSKPTMEEIAAAEQAKAREASFSALEASSEMHSGQGGTLAITTEPIATDPITAEPDTAVSLVSAPVTQRQTPRNPALADDGQASQHVQDSAHAIGEPEAQDNSASQAETASTLTIVLSGDCWLNIKDASGKTLVDGVKSPSDELKLSGRAPFKVILGAPQTAIMHFNGQSVSLAAFPAGRVARLTLPQTE